MIGLCLGYMLFSGNAKGESIDRALDTRDNTQSALVRMVEGYQKEISPVLHDAAGRKNICRYEPSCSEYAKQAVQEYGSVKGTAMAAARLARCNPLSSGGYDPVLKTSA